MPSGSRSRLWRVAATVNRPRGSVRVSCSVSRPVPMTEGEGGEGSGWGVGPERRARSRAAAVILGNYTLPPMAAPLTTGPAHSDAELARVLRVERPDPNLMTYYALASLLAGPFFFI